MDIVKLNFTSPSSSFWEFNGKRDYVDKWPLMGAPYPILLILAFYLVFVTKLGPQYMKNRSPYRLTNVLMLYNAVQVVISFMIFYTGAQFFLRHGLVRKRCLMNDMNFDSNLLLNLSYSYMLAKITELLDTIFFVLRKNQRQVTFLHLYHHTVMVLMTWIGHKYEQNENFLFLGTLNSAVHIIMYTYYGFSAIRSLQKYLWWKKYITSLQLIQFVAVFIHLVICRIVSDCPPSMGLFYFALVNMILFYYLFNNFYKRNYNMPKNKDINNNDVNSKLKVNNNGVKQSKKK